MRPQSRCVTGCVGEIPTCYSEKSPIVRTGFFESSLQDKDIEGRCKVYEGKTSWKTSCWQLYLCKQEERSIWSTLTDDPYSSSIRFVPKHVTLSQKMHLALLASIPLTLLTSSEVLPCTHRADMPLDVLEKFELVRVRRPTSRCSDCKKVCKARATSAWHGIADRIEIPWGKTPCPWM